MQEIHILVLVLFSLTIKGQFYQYFDGANTNPMNSLIVTIPTTSKNIWHVGPPQKTLFNAASTLPNVIVTDTLYKYPVNNTSAFNFRYIHPFFPASFTPPLAVRWKQKLDMESKKDGGIVEFSTNSGVTWQNAHNNPNTYQFYGFLPGSKDTINGNEYCFSGTDNVWRDIWLCINGSTAYQNDTIMFRFTFKSDSVNSDQEGWMIDNFMIQPTFIHPVKETSNVGDIVVYPNKSSGIVNVEMSKKSNSDVINNIELFNIEGKRLETYGQNYTKVVLDISKYPPGIYFLKVTIGKKTTSHKIIYEKN